MEKDFDSWNKYKKAIDKSNSGPDFHEREIWWCSIGVNVGSEQLSQSPDFSRPVLIIKKFTREIFLGIPLTTKVKDIKFRYRLMVNKVENDLLILQARSFDNKRLIRKITTLPQIEFNKVLEEIKDSLK